MDAPKYGTLVRDETSMGFGCTTRIRVSVSSKIERRKKLVQPIDFLEPIRPGTGSVVGLDGPAYRGYRLGERVSRHEASVSFHSLYGLCHWLEKALILSIIGTGVHICILARRTNEGLSKQLQGHIL